MEESRKNLLIELILGLCIAIVSAILMDVFHAETLRDTFRLLSDCFFLPGAFLLAYAGLTWTKNGGVWDGLGFTMKSMFERMKPDFDNNRTSFAKYRETRGSKNTSPVPSFLAGLVYFALAIVFLVLYNMTA